jgi:hypothetical protein
MTVYSYNAQQLKKKIGPRKKFWSADKIAIAAGSFFVVSLGALVATAPAPVGTEVVASPSPVVKSSVGNTLKPVKVAETVKTPEPYCSTYTNWKGEKVQECVEATPNWEEKVEEHARLQQLNNQRAAESRWDRAYAENREAQCKAGTIHHQYC